MSIKKRHSRAVFVLSSLAFAIGVAQAATIDSWNRDNVVTDLPNWPPGVEPTHVPGVTYDSKLYTDNTRLESNGAVIWKEGAVVTPGATVLTESPDVGNNCIITSGTNRAVPGAIPKTCTDEFQSAKRVKLEAREPGTPLDMVFNASESDDVARAYRVFKKYINATGQRMDGFVVELGFGTGADFVASSDNDGLKFTKRQKGNNPNIEDFEPLPFFSTPPGNSDLGSLMSAGLFGNAAANQNRSIDGYFGLPDGVLPWTDPTCDPDPSETGRSYYDLVVLDEDRIETDGNVQGLHYCLFGNMLPQGQLPLGFFWDDDGDPVTDADTIADWDGSGESPACGGTPCWHTYVVIDEDPNSPGFGDPVLVDGNFTRPTNPPVPVSQDVIDFWVANPEPEIPDGSQFYFITELDDMGLVNNNYHITVESVTEWPTYNEATGSATFTMRTSNVGEGEDFVAPWLTTLPSELESTPVSADVAIALDIAGTVEEGTEVPVELSVTNIATDTTDAAGQIVGEATDADTGKPVASFYGEFSDLAPGVSLVFTFNWLVSDPTGLPEKVIWAATAYLEGTDPVVSIQAEPVAVEITPAPITVDVAISQFEVPGDVKSGEEEEIKVTVSNSKDAIEAASGTVTVEVDGEEVFSKDFSGLEAGDAEEYTFEWEAPRVTKPTYVSWIANVTADGDSNPSNDTAIATTKVKPSRRK